MSEIITIDTTVGGSSSNSYITLSEARDKAKLLLNGDSFLDKSEQEQIKLLVQACQNMERLRYNYNKYSSAQALSFPRDATPDNNIDEDDTDSGEIPEVIKWVQIEEAIALSQGFTPERGGSKTIGNVRYSSVGRNLASQEGYARLSKSGWLVAPPNCSVSLKVF